MKTADLVPNYMEVRNAQTWAGGPTHTLQRQHVPGYQGFVKGLDSENVHGKTFARITAECINGRQYVGPEYTPDERYKTSYHMEFKEPYLRKQPLTDAAETLLNQRKSEQAMIQNAIIQDYQKAPKSINDIDPIDRVPIVGYQGHRAVYRHPIKSVQPPQQPIFQQSQFDSLPYEQQKYLVEQELAKNKRLSDKQPPVVGYTGFQKGINAENMFGKTFNDISKNSQRM